MKGEGVSRVANVFSATPISLQPVVKEKKRRANRPPQKKPDFPEDLLAELIMVRIHSQMWRNKGMRGEWTKGSGVKVPYLVLICLGASWQEE